MNSLTKSRFMKKVLKNTYDKNYRMKHLWTVGSEIQKGKCNLCNNKLRNGNMIVDHIVQKQYFSKYGEKINNIENFQVLCSSCNSIKTHQVDKKINILIKQNDVKTQSYDTLRIYTINLLRKIYREKCDSLAKVKELSDYDSDKEDELKNVEKVFSNLEIISNNEIEYDELPNNLTTIKTRSKSGLLPKKKEIFSPNLEITRNKRKLDTDYSDYEFDVLDDNISENISEENTQIIKKKKDGKYISLIFKNCTFSNCTISL
jgi:hypothetical protein